LNHRNRGRKIAKKEKVDRTIRVWQKIIRQREPGWHTAEELSRSNHKRDRRDFPDKKALAIAGGASNGKLLSKGGRSTEGFKRKNRKGYKMAGGKGVVHRVGRTPQALQPERETRSKAKECKLVGGPCWPVALIRGGG